MRPIPVLILAALTLAACASADPGQIRMGKPSLDTAPHHGPGTPVTRLGGR
jgi:hypothetical protein